MALAATILNRTQHLPCISTDSCRVGSPTKSITYFLTLTKTT